MTKLTIGRMAKLYGLHRSTLHEAVAKGRVNAGHDGKGQRVIDLSEMIRVYGEAPNRPTPLPDTQPTAFDTRPTPSDIPTGWAEMVIELRLLREEVAGLRQELRLLEHKPATDTAANLTPTEIAPPATEKAQPEPKAESVGTHRTVSAGDGQSDHAPAVAVKSFAEIHLSWD